MDARKPHIAIFPSSGMGHLIPFFEFAKLLASDHGFSVTFITAKFMVSPSQTAYTKSLASSGLSIRFIELPEVEMDSEEKKLHPLAKIFKVMGKCTGLVENVLRALLSDSSNPVSAFITDIFCTGTLEMSKKLQIPSYVLYTGSASNIFIILYHPTMDARMPESLKDLDGPVKVPGLPPIPARDFPDPMQDKSGPFYHLFLRLSNQLLNADGILVNSFQDLERGSVQALRSGQIDGKRIPSVYPVGPLISPPESDGSGSLQWLDKQPDASVLFVSFGSVNFLSAAQIVELALGLEGSGQRFLWVLPSPPNTVSNPEISALLPPGFEQRTKDRGLVVTSWAPQVAILAHPSTGGFVSHCGWNSVLESVSHGVPIIAWPLQAEQRTTAFFLVNDIKMAIRVQRGADGIVGKEEVEKAAKELMEGEEGKKKTARARELRESAKAALAEGGSSSQALAAVAALFSN